MKELDQTKFGMQIIEDLGMVKQGNRNIRYAKFKCSSCADEIVIATTNAMTKKGIKRALCQKCSKIIGDSKKIKKLEQKNYNLKIIKDLGKQQTTGKTFARLAIFECNECKKHITLQTSSERTKTRKACDNCLHPTRNSTSKLYTIWNAIKQRCYNKKRKDYKSYGGVGVTICKEWKTDPIAFITWCENNGWKEGLVIDKDKKCKLLNIQPAIYSPETLSFLTTQENAEEANGKQVEQYTKEGKLLNTFASTAAAAKFISPTNNRSTIGNCCRGTTKSSYGYIWKYKEIK